MTTRDLWANQLDAGLAEMGLELAAAQGDRLLGFLELLVTWNRAFNLTAIRDPRKLVPRHLLDSLSLLPYLQGPSVLDVGTGAGLPGIPLAIARPAWSFTLLDSNSKKTRFVTQVRLELGLENLSVVHDRVEHWQASQAFQSITSRAFARLDRMFTLTRHLAGPATVWVAMKGPGEAAEQAELPTGIHLAAHTVHVPGEEARRRIVLMRPPARE
jgi:16S rRNA (guanine527-N7)-methyltransferase